MGKIILISGGIKSGKSKFALSFFDNKKAYFIATAQPKDKEMKNKVLLHKKYRPKNFILIEEPTKINEVVSTKLNKNFGVIIDCINMWVANLMKIYNEKEILSEVEILCKNLRKFKMSILVSNEVGMSLVSVNKLGRKFQELLGLVNQLLAKYADRVYFMISGLPFKIK